MNTSLNSVFSPETQDKIREREVAMSALTGSLKRDFKVGPQSNAVFGRGGGEYYATVTEVRFTEGDYDRLKEWLTQKYGSPEPSTYTWHRQRNNETPMQFRVTTDQVITLVRMMNRKDKMYTLLTWI